MRSELLKLQKYNSTKNERRVGEILKRNKIKFKCKWRVGKYEIDFIIGRVALEIDGDVHKEIDSKRDTYLASKGYVPLHICAKGRDIREVREEIINLIKYNNE